MFGGNLYTGWSSALVARNFMAGYVERLKGAVAISEEFFEAIGQHPSFVVTRIANGTNVTKVKILSMNGGEFRTRLAKQNIFLGLPTADNSFSISVNETWNRISPKRLVAAFTNALPE